MTCVALVNVVELQFVPPKFATAPVMKPVPVITTLVPPDGLTPAQRTSFARGHTPIGRGFSETRLPEQIDLPFQVLVGTFISSAGTPTFYWNSAAGLAYLRGGSSTILTIPFRPDFPVDRALAVVRDMSEKQ